MAEGASDLLLDALYPRRCPVCGDIVMPRGMLICPPCERRLSFVKPPLCMKCGKEIVSGETEYCPDCTRHRRSFSYGVSLLNYTEEAAGSMAAVKYKNKREYLDYFAGAAAERCGREILRMGADCIVPVPIHSSRRKMRGFNQAELLAEKLGDKLGIPVCPEFLRRIKNTEPQKELGPLERLHNLEKAFEADAGCRGMNILLADDIYTTGSTIEACSRALKKAGAKNVYFFTVCIGQGR